MFEFLKSARLGNVITQAKPWTLDRNWHRSEAERHLQAQNFHEAHRHLTVAVDEADARYAPPKQRVRLRLELADTQRRLAASDPEKLARAESTVRAAIEIAAVEGDQDGYVNGLDALADVFADAKNFPALEKTEEHAIRLGAKLPHPDPLRMAKRVHRLAVARHKNGHSAESVPALEKSITLHEQTCGADSLQMAELLTEIGCIFRDQGESTRAKECLHRTLGIQERQLGPDAPQTMETIQHLAGCYEDEGDLNGAAQQYERYLALKQRKLGAQNIEEVAVMQYSLANLHAGWGNLPRSRELLSDCIAAFRREGGARLAVAHELLAQIEERAGRFHSAVRELELAAKVWEKCGRRTELIRNLSYRADVLDQLRKTKEANWLRETVSNLQSEGIGQAQTA